MAVERCPNCQASLAVHATTCWRCKADFGEGSAWQPEQDEPEPLPPKSPAYRWKWLLIGALYGVLVRVAFEFLPGSFAGPMSLAFLVGAPLAVGAIAVYGADDAVSTRRSLTLPWLPTTMMLIGTAITLLEGAICIAIMTPLFYGLASLGGFFMGMAKHAFQSPGGSKSTLGAFAMLPVLLAPLDARPLPDTFREIRESVLIDAPAPVVWQNIVSAQRIQAHELPISLTHLIGVPRPVDAQNRILPDGRGELRDSHWEKGVHFTAQIVERHEPSSITWRYHFTPDSFPKGSMDEHVVLGGKYLDLGDTTFRLLPEAGGTRLEVIGRYRLSTPINAYAVPVSRVLGHDFLRTLLGFYKLRAEQAAKRV